MNKWGLAIVLLMVLAAVLAGCKQADTVAAGDGILQLTLKLPDGYHLNTTTRHILS